MATKIKTLIQKQFGHVPFRSLIESGKKGGYVASTKYNNQEFVGYGPSERQATMDLQQKLDKAVAEYKVTIRSEA
jgi:hypothetical protein